MEFTRMYTGEDGESHIEAIDLAGRPDLAELEAANGISFRINPPGRGTSDFHPGPRRQYVITLSGAGEIGLGDGSMHVFGPGHVSLVEDTTGRGHTTRVMGDEPRVTATIPLVDQKGL
jgi:hypothetical protein